VHPLGSPLPAAAPPNPFPCSIDATHVGCSGLDIISLLEPTVIRIGAADSACGAKLDNGMVSFADYNLRSRDPMVFTGVFCDLKLVSTRPRQPSPPRF
jgi:hypothetical protein